MYTPNFDSLIDMIDDALGTSYDIFLYGGGENADELNIRFEDRAYPLDLRKKGDGIKINKTYLKKVDLYNLPEFKGDLGAYETAGVWSRFNVGEQVLGCLAIEDGTGFVAFAHFASIKNRWRLIRVDQYSRDQDLEECSIAYSEKGKEYEELIGDHSELSTFVGCESAYTNYAADSAMKALFG